MGLRWLRGPTGNSSGVNDGTNDYARTTKDFSLFVFYYLRRILGWTFVEEQTIGTWVFDTAHSQTGTDGVLTNTDYTFTAASATFSAADVGRFLVVVDATNESNCGIYEILTQPSSTQLTINFYTTGGNFPTAQSGLTWYVIDGDFDNDIRVGDYFVMESGHSTNPCTMKFTVAGNTGQNSNSGLSIEVASEAGAWDTIGHTWNTGVALMSHLAKIPRGNVTQAHGRTFAIGHTDGSFFHIWSHHNNAVGNKQGAGIVVATALESSPTPNVKEMIGLFGIGNGASDNSSWDRSFNNEFDDMCTTRWWSENLSKSTLSFWAAWWDGPGGIDLFRHTGGVNARTSQRDGLPIWITKDSFIVPDNLWAPWGEIPTSQMLLGSVNALGEHTAFDSDNYFHIRDGVVIPWPGIPFA